LQSQLQKSGDVVAMQDTESIVSQAIPQIPSGEPVQKPIVSSGTYPLSTLSKSSHAVPQPGTSPGMASPTGIEISLPDRELFRPIDAVHINPPITDRNQGTPLINPRKPTTPQHHNQHRNNNR